MRKSTKCTSDGRQAHCMNLVQATKDSRTQQLNVESEVATQRQSPTPCRYGSPQIETRRGSESRKLPKTFVQTLCSSSSKSDDSSTSFKTCMIDQVRCCSGPTVTEDVSMGAGARISLQQIASQHPAEALWVPYLLRDMRPAWRYVALHATRIIARVDSFQPFLSLFFPKLSLTTQHFPLHVTHHTLKHSVQNMTDRFTVEAGTTQLRKPSQCYGISTDQGSPFCAFMYRQSPICACVHACMPSPHAA